MGQPTTTTPSPTTAAMASTKTERSGIAVGPNKGHKTEARVVKPRISRSKGKASKRTQFVREIVKEVSGLAPYEHRVIELLRNSKDKRARKLAKKRLALSVSPSSHFKPYRTIPYPLAQTASNRSTDTIFIQPLKFPV